MSDHWIEQGESPYPHEREALAWVRSWFPTHEPWRSFARFSFPGNDGRDHEIDLLVAGPTGCFLIEFKAHDGRITGDARNLVSSSGQRRKAFDHPKPLLKSKLDKLVESLKQTEAYRSRESERRPPFIEPIVFLHHADSLDIAPPGGAGVVLRDRDDPPVPGLKTLLLERRAAWLQPLAEGERRVDKPAAKLLTSALRSIAYFGPRPPLVAGSWPIEQPPLETAPAWSDFNARHRHTGEQRTVRIYIAPRDRELDRARLENTARLEYEALRTFDHLGVLRAHELHECDLGFAIVFDPTTELVRLDHFLLTRGAKLDFPARLGLLRQLCEAVSAAHDRGVAHRGLVPSAVLVANPDSDRPVLKLRNWHRRMRTDAAASSGVQTFGGETIDDLSGDGDGFTEIERTYLAPELRRVGEPGGIASDIYSLGALACLLFAGQPPARTLEELDGILTRQGHLSVSQHLNGASAALERFIARSANVSPLERATTARELIECLDGAQDELARPEATNLRGPDDLVKDVVLDGGPDGAVRVVRRLGSGGTAVGFEVSRDQFRLALKVARSPELNARLDAEATALDALHHEHIVERVHTLTVGECRGLLLKPFGGETLHDYLKRDGPLQIEFLERWGGQLLSAVEHLEHLGRSHRDIKPGNIGITDRGQKRAQQIVLFDFSLAALPADNLNAGTPGYIDPFLGTAKRRIWDRAAERYSAAVTLYEMATAARPVWGDGQTLPTLLRDVEHPNLDGDLLPYGVRDSLLTFFQRALHRDAARRFDSASAMAEAWSKALAGHEVTVIGTRTAEGEAPTLVTALDAAVAGKGVETIIPSLPLSNRAQHTLQRLGVDTIRDLLQRTPHSLRWLAGVGRTTQQELFELYQEAKARFPDVEVTIRTPEQSRDEANARRGGSKRPKASASVPADATLEVLARSLLERNREGGSRSNDALADYLGLGEAGRSDRPEPASIQAAASAHQLTRAAVHIAIDGAAKRWRRNEAFVHAGNVVSELITARGGVATLDEIATAIAARLPGDGTGSADQRAAAGFAVALAVTEAERRIGPDHRFELRRMGRALMVVAKGLEAAAGYAIELGKVADRLVDPANPVLPSRSASLAELREVPSALGLTELPDERLLDLAVAASGNARRNVRGELYPNRLDPRRALKLSQGAIGGLGTVDMAARRRVFKVEDLRARVSQRYPDAAPIPDAPECLSMVREVFGHDVRYDEATREFRVPIAEVMTVASASSVQPTIYETPHYPAAPDGRTRERMRADEFRREIASALADRRLLVARVRLGSFAGALPRLASSFGLRHVSLDALIVDGMHEVAMRKSINLERIRAADREWPAGADSHRLRVVLNEVHDRHLVPALLSPAGPILVSDWGLLCRYGLQAIYTQLRDACGTGSHPGAICVVPADPAEESINLDGNHFPEHDPARIVAVPEAWLRLEAA
jgi:serine/threonine protein kinase